MQNELQCDVICGDSRKVLREYTGLASLIVTSPPYADARKTHYDSISPEDFPDWFVSFHDAFWNTLEENGSLVINIKDKVVDGVRHRYVWHVIEKLTRLGWHCIDDYIWYKPNPMPGFWPTRLRDGWEYCFHLAKCKKPYVNQDAVRIPVGDWVKSRLQNLSDNDKQRHNSVNKSGFGRAIHKWVGKNTVLPSNVIKAPLVGKNKGHPAVYPVELPLFFIKLLSREGSVVIDPFGGSGTTAIAALDTGRNCILIDNNAKYCQVAHKRIQNEIDCLNKRIHLNAFYNTLPKARQNAELQDYITA